MRCDQPMGLTREAKRFLGEYMTDERCPTCGHRKFPTPEVIGTYDGLGGQDYPLNRYVLKEGHADEYLQTSPWSSGPIFFIGLRIYNQYGTLEGTIEWTEQEIEDAVW